MINIDEIEARALAATANLRLDGLDILSPSDYIAAMHSTNPADGELFVNSGVDILATCAEIRRLRDGIAKTEARWRATSQDKTFTRHYRDTMKECADELRDLLAGVG